MLCSPQKFEREPSLGVVQPTHPHERSFFVSTFEDQTQEDTLAKERWARGEACRLGHKRAQTHWRLGSKQGNILLTFGSLESSCAIIDQTRGKIVLSWIRVPSCTPSRIDLNSAALETVRAFRTSTKVISANRGSANERGSDNVCQRVGFIRDSTALRRHTAQFYRFDNSARIMGIPYEWTKWSKNTSYETVHAMQRTSCLQLSQACQADLRAPVRHSRQLRLHHKTQQDKNPRRHQKKRGSKQDRRLPRGDLERTLESKEDDNLARRDLMHDLPEWLQEFAENLVDREASILEVAGPREPSIPEP